MPKYSSLQEVQTALRAGEETCAGLVSYYLQQIEETRPQVAQILKS